jgi:hypothetical protein
MTHRPTTVIINVTITQFITVITNIAETPRMTSTARSALLINHCLLAEAAP